MKEELSKSRLMRLKEVLEIYPVSKTTWYRGVNEGIYPRPLKLGSRTVAWKESEIVELIENMQRV